jgi:hypothetical protein
VRTGGRVGGRVGGLTGLPLTGGATGGGATGSGAALVVADGSGVGDWVTSCVMTGAGCLVCGPHPASAIAKTRQTASRLIGQRPGESYGRGTGLAEGSPH